MKRIGVFVGDNGNWSFFKDVFEGIDGSFQKNAFKPREFHLPLLSGRLNRWAFREGIRSTLRNSDLGFFEWASDLLAIASHMPKYCPIVTRLHAYELFVWAPKINWEHIDRVIFVSNSMKDKFAKLFPEHAHKAEVIHNGISVEKFKPPSQRVFEFNIGMLCRIHPVKRVYEIILMLDNLKKQGHNPHLHIAGGKDPGGYFDDYFVAVQRLIEKLGLQNEVIQYGEIDNANEWLKKIDIFISNSYFEGQQVALLEAMAAGCYCLSHFWDGAEEIVPAENLYSNEYELQEKIIAYCNLPDADKLQQQSLMRAIACEKFDIRQTIAKINRVIKEVSRPSPEVSTNLH